MTIPDGPADLVFAGIAVGVARILARVRPGRLRQVMTRIGAGVPPAGYGQALRAQDSVVAVSRTCRGPDGCLPRAIATALVCRFHGCWPTWRVGVRTAGSFGAHAWVEAEGLMVGEYAPLGGLHPMITIAPIVRATGAGRHPGDTNAEA